MDTKTTNTTPPEIKTAGESCCGGKQEPAVAKPTQEPAKEQEKAQPGSSCCCK